MAKRLLYVFVFSVFVGVLSSCAEEIVTPSTPDSVILKSPAAPKTPPKK